MPATVVPVLEQEHRMCLAGSGMHVCFELGFFRVVLFRRIDNALYLLQSL